MTSLILYRLRFIGEGMLQRPRISANHLLRGHAPLPKREAVRASVCMARKMRLVRKRGQLFTGEFLIDFRDLG